MSKGVLGARLKGSVFARLMVTMLAMALTILVLVAGFFSLIVTPTLQESTNAVAEQYVDLLASTSPDRSTVERAVRRLDLRVRYEGPRGTWSTSPELPSIAAARVSDPGFLARLGHIGPRHRIVSRPNGDSYLFVWGFPEKLRSAHDWMLLVLLGSLLVAVMVAHASLRRMLTPLRELLKGVTALSEGNLEVVVASQSGNEFEKLTDAFNDMVARVREMLRARDRLLLDVSHELRSPLTRMRIALALADDHPQKERLLSNVAQMESMVTELLELERLREGGGLNRGMCDLMPIVRAVVDSFEGRPPGATITAAPREVRLWIDPDKIRCVLENLLENAFKYSLSDSRPVDVSVAVGENGVVVRVADTGPGIPAEDLPHLFEPFFRVDRSRSRKTGGYGLGLSLCRRIMESHGGAIAAKNNTERGASFVLTFPVGGEASHQGQQSCRRPLPHAVS